MRDCCLKEDSSIKKKKQKKPLVLHNNYSISVSRAVKHAIMSESWYYIFLQSTKKNTIQIRKHI